MKKKHGFTLAEVLITLGIIGVVAALTAPALIQNASNAKVGPTLAKVVSTIENANQKMMLDEGGTKLTSIGAETALKYIKLLSEYISGSSYETTVIGGSSSYPNNIVDYKGSAYSSTKGAYIFHFSNSIDIAVIRNGTYSAKGSFLGGVYFLYVDINGLNTQPNALGKDIFFFFMDNNGSIIPYGGKTYAFAGTTNNSVLWESLCNATTVTDGAACAGSIFDNNLKVIYQ